MSHRHACRVLGLFALAVLAFAISLGQTKRYQASADVFLGSQNVSSNLSAVDQIFRDPVRAVETRSRTVADGSPSRAPASFSPQNRLRKI